LGTTEGSLGKVLITGGAGFIGSELVRQLAAQASEVVIVDNLCNGKLANIEEVLGSSVRFEECDIRDEQGMRPLFEEVDVVYHLACLGVRHSIHSPVENQAVNATATLTLLMLAREMNCGRFVYVSSSEIYGTADRVPMSEDCPTFPHTVYGAGKLAGDCYTRAFWDTYQMPTVVVRPFNSYGPRSHHEGDSGEVIPKFLLRTLAGKAMTIFGDGTQTRDFTFVSDTALAIMLAGTKPAAVGKTINVGFGAEISVNELARTVAEVTGRDDAVIEHAEPRPGDVLRLHSDTRLAEELLGYRAKVSLRDGLVALLDWYQSKGLTPEELLKEEIERNWEGAK
jgi:UDP-glucose 4-epimerase